MWLNVLLAGGMLIPGQGIEVKKPGAFELQAIPLAVLEGGPFVLKIKLRYRGKQPIRIYRRYQISNVSCDVPADWIFQLRVRGVMGIVDGSADLHPGDEVSEIVSLHHTYSNISKGKKTLTIRWSVYTPGKHRQLIASPATTVTIDVPQANAANIARLGKQLEESLNNLALSEYDWWGLRDTLWYTKHPALGSVVCDLMSTCPDSYPAEYLLNLCYQMDKPPYRTANAHLVHFVSSQRSEHAPLVFSRWRADRAVLAPAEFQKLCRSPHVWIKVLTYVTFPGQCDKRWKAGFLEEVRSSSQPLPSAHFTHLLRDLDDDAFAVREKASGRLEQLGERVEGQLRQALQTPLSPEAKRRVERILKHIEATPLPPDCLPTLHYLADTVKTPEAKQVLAILARGDPAFRLTKEAQYALRRMGETVPSGQ